MPQAAFVDFFYKTYFLLIPEIGKEDGVSKSRYFFPINFLPECLMA